MSAHLDLEDVAHGHPKAQEELRELYARLDVAERMAQALGELVALKDMKDTFPTLDGQRSNFGHYADALAAYERRKPLAWEAARKVHAEWEELK